MGLNAKLRTLLLATTVFLTGCTGMHTDFGCNATANEGCTPVDQVNDQAEFGVYDKRHAGRIPMPSRSGTQSSSYEITQNEESLRQGENVQRIWIAPFKDRDGNYHGPSYVYSAVKSPAVSDQDSWKTES